LSEQEKATQFRPTEYIAPVIMALAVAALFGWLIFRSIQRQRTPPPTQPVFKWNAPIPESRHNGSGNAPVARP
jgi:hypothetical protein